MTHLFLTFVKYGLLCFGGGYMLIPLLLSDFVGEGKVFTSEEFGNLVSIAQVTPGPVGINTATYVGYLQGAFLGALLATFGLVVPSLILGSAAVTGINRWKDTFAVRGILRGTRLASIAMILFAVTVFWGMSIFTASIPWNYLIKWVTFQHPEAVQGFGFSWEGCLICVVCFLLMLKTKVPTTVLILGSAAAGAVFALI